MVLWEITLGTAYFLGLKRTYRLALKTNGSSSALIALGLSNLFIDELEMCLMRHLVFIASLQLRSEDNLHQPLKQAAPWESS
ncbi:hypothetical protein AAHA92_00432 [Salvia divinorum]|uniref:Uncharacterized protein n=1 Tax=Salvia divinorum TaxID=28513 RepID=A0ABD1IJJ4_SALDI